MKLFFFRRQDILVAAGKKGAVPFPQGSRNRDLCFVWFTHFHKICKILK